jgi:hypothetical protein
MAVVDHGPMLRACEAELTDENLIELLDCLIKSRWWLGEAVDSARIEAVTLAFFDGSAPDGRKQGVLEMLLCWLEQQDEPGTNLPRPDVPSRRFLYGLCCALMDMPRDNASVHKLWMLYLYNADGYPPAYDEYGEFLNQNYFWLWMAFRDGVPWPEREEPCRRRLLSDKVRRIRYEMIVGQVLARQAVVDYDDHIFHSFRRLLLESLQTEERDFSLRRDPAKNLSALRIGLRSHLASLYLKRRCVNEAVGQLSNSATEQLISSVLLGEEAGFRGFLEALSAMPLGMTSGCLRRMVLRGLKLPHRAAMDFVTFTVARAHLRKAAGHAEGGRQFLGVAKRLLKQQLDDREGVWSNNTAVAVFHHAYDCICAAIIAYE